MDKARENRIPVLDCVNTLIPFQKHYVQDRNLPNKEGSKIIAEGIASIVRDYDEQKGFTLNHLQVMTIEWLPILTITSCRL